MGRGLKLDHRAQMRPIGLESSLESGGKGGARGDWGCVGLFSVLTVLAVNTFRLSFYRFNYLAGAHFIEVNDLYYRICIMDFAYEHG